MQTCGEGDRAVHPEHGPGLVVRVLHQSARCLGGAAVVEAIFRDDRTGKPWPVCIDDLAPELPDDDRR